MVSFNDVPSNVLTPWAFVVIDNSGAVQGSVDQAFNSLLIGQKFAAGTKAAGALVQVTNEDQAAEFFGKNSMLHLMVKSFKAQNEFGRLYCIALDDDGAAVKAAADFTFTGTVSKAGTLYIYLAGHRLKVAAAKDATATDLATAVSAAINASDLPFTSTATAGKVDVVYKHAGEVGNNLDLSFNYYEGEDLPQGVTVAITGFSGGTANPDVADAIAAFGDRQYNVLSMPYVDTDNMNKMEQELGDRWLPTKQIDGMCFMAHNGNHSEMSTFGQSKNSFLMSVDSSYGSPSAVFEWAAAKAGLVAKHIEIDSARPLQTLEMKGILAPVEDKRFTREERNLLLLDGISTSFVDAGGKVVVEAVITMYKKNALGADDISYRYINTVYINSKLRYDIRNRLLLKFPRHKLANDGTQFAPGQKVVTPKVIKAELVNLAKEWESKAIVEEIKQFINDMIVVRSTSNPNRIDFKIKPDTVNQMRVFGGQIAFLL